MSFITEQMTGEPHLFIFHRPVLETVYLFFRDQSPILARLATWLNITNLSRSIDLFRCFSSKEISSGVRELNLCVILLFKFSSEPRDWAQSLQFLLVSFVLCSPKLSFQHTTQSPFPLTILDPAPPHLGFTGVLTLPTPLFKSQVWVRLFFREQSVSKTIAGRFGRKKIAPCAENIASVTPASPWNLIQGFKRFERSNPFLPRDFGPNTSTFPLPPNTSLLQQWSTKSSDCLLERIPGQWENFLFLQAT